MSKPNHGLIVTFYTKPVKLIEESEKAGREIYRDVEHVNIIIPGDKNSEIDTKANDTLRKEYAEEYARFKAGEKEVLTGTPLSQWPPMGRSLVKEWAYLNVHTVEQLAELSDTAKQAFGMGAAGWVEKAKAFLKVADDSSAVSEYVAENAKLKERLDEQAQLIRELSAAVKDMREQPATPERRGPGRPPKIREDEAA